jgi:hypothetical protein
MLALRRMSDAFGGVQKLAPGTEKLAGCFTGNGNAAHSPSDGQTRRVNQASGGPITTRESAWTGAIY